MRFPQGRGWGVGEKQGPGTKGPGTRDQGTRGPRDQGTRDQGTRDQGTKGPRDQRTRGPGKARSVRCGSWFYCARGEGKYLQATGTCGAVNRRLRGSCGAVNRRLRGSCGAANRRLRAMGLVVSHPCDRNRNVARVGHRVLLLVAFRLGFLARLGRRLRRGF
jgi:hypothetical protein